MAIFENTPRAFQTSEFIAVAKAERQAYLKQTISNLFGRTNLRSRAK